MKMQVQSRRGSSINSSPGVSPRRSRHRTVRRYGRSRLLPRRFPDQSLAILFVDGSGFHYEAGFAHYADIVQGIAWYCGDIGKFAGRDATEFLVFFEQLGGVDGGGL